ncbi:MAG: CoA transferase, partial [Candidatus Binataceae bacterium]
MASTDAACPAGKYPLDGISVIECGEGVSAAFAAKLMADLGAEVIKIEPPSGDWARRRGPFPGGQPDPEKSGLFIYLNANKIGVTLDLADSGQRTILNRLLERADIFIHNCPLNTREQFGISGKRLSIEYPKLVSGAISPFGDNGPYSGWKAYELNIVNAGGWAYLSPGSSKFPKLPPLKTFGHVGGFHAGMHACFAVLSAFWRRLVSGAGEHVEVSAQECVAAMLELSLVHFTYAGRETSRLGARQAAPWTIMQCADGHVMVLCLEDDQWRRLAELMGNPEWTTDPLFADRRSRAENADALYALMHDCIHTWRTEDLFREAQKRRIPLAPVSTMKQLYESSHLSERQYFAPLNQPGVGELKIPGCPFKSSAEGWRQSGRAPRLGQHNDAIPGTSAARLKERTADLTNCPASSQGTALAGIRILDLTWVWAGPYCTLQFAHM